MMILPSAALTSVSGKGQLVHIPTHNDNYGPQSSEPQLLPSTTSSTHVSPWATMTWPTKSPSTLDSATQDMLCCMLQSSSDCQSSTWTYQDDGPPSAKPTDLAAATNVEKTPWSISEPNLTWPLFSITTKQSIQSAISELQALPILTADSMVDKLDTALLSAGESISSFLEGFRPPGSTTSDSLTSNGGTWTTSSAQSTDFEADSPDTTVSGNQERLPTVTKGPLWGDTALETTEPDLSTHLTYPSASISGGMVASSQFSSTRNVFSPLINVPTESQATANLPPSATSFGTDSTWSNSISGIFTEVYSTHVAKPTPIILTTSTKVTNISYMISSDPIYTPSSVLRLTTPKRSTILKNLQLMPPLWDPGSRLSTESPPTLLSLVPTSSFSQPSSFTTTTTDNPMTHESILQDASQSRHVSIRSVVVSVGVIAGAGVIVVGILILHPKFRRLVRHHQKEPVWVSLQSEISAQEHAQLVSQQTATQEISRFSMDS